VGLLIFAFSLKGPEMNALLKRALVTAVLCVPLLAGTVSAASTAAGPEGAGHARKDATMQVNITGHHVDITDDLRAFVTAKFEKLQTHFGGINQVYVVLSSGRGQKVAEATLHVNGGEVHAAGEREDMYSAIDAMVDKLARQLNKGGR